MREVFAVRSDGSVYRAGWLASIREDATTGTIKVRQDDYRAECGGRSSSRWTTINGAIAYRDRARTVLVRLVGGELFLVE